MKQLIAKMKITRNSATTIGLILAVAPMLLGLRASGAQFEDVTVSARLINENGYCITAAWGDYNNDGYIDLYLGIGANSSYVNALYRNNGDGTFTRVGAEAGPITTDAHDSFGCAWIDFDNDGYRDMFVLNGGWWASRNDLYWNNGDGTFRSADAGDLTGLSRARSWSACADYDSDGWVDVYVPEGASGSGPMDNRLYRATGTGGFTFSKLGATVDYANSGVWGDYDNDNDPDLFICGYGSASVLWHNDGGGHFTAVANGLPSTAGTLHASWADYDGDRDLDIALSSWSGTSIYRNGGSGFALATTLPAAVAGGAWADYDNDGYLDFLGGCGQDSAKRLALYHNNGDGTFSLMQDEFPNAGNWLAFPWGDFDNDGFMDVAITHQFGANRLFRNLGNTNHWIKFKLIGTASNRDAIGARVRVQATIASKSVWQMQEVNGGYSMQNDTRLNFGLGDATNVDQVRIEWPSGIVQTLANFAPGQILEVTEERRPVLTLATTPAALVGSLKGQRNRVYQVLVSADLANWTMFTNITANALGRATWSDPNSAEEGCRFYKAQMTP